MDDMTFDTLAAAQSLREAGFEDRQAEAVAETVRNGREGLATKAEHETLATKADIADLRAETREKFAALETTITELRAETREKFTVLEAKIAALRDELRADAAERETRLIRWVVGSMIGLAVAVAAIVGVAAAVFA